MDLSTVRNQIMKDVYHTIEECYADIDLIWVNCKTYNMPDSEIYKQAEIMEKVTAQTKKKLKLFSTNEKNVTEGSDTYE